MIVIPSPPSVHLATGLEENLVTLGCEAVILTLSDHSDVKSLTGLGKSGGHMCQVHQEITV